VSHPPRLRLVREARIADLLAPDNSDRHPRLEASGVLVRDGLCLVVFDNLPMLGLLDDRFAVPGPHRAVTLTGGRGHDYEDLAADLATGRLFVLVEALPEGPPYRACVEEYDDRYQLVASKPLDFPLQRPNKGIEGLSCMRRDGRTYLLGLCEGNRGRAGAEGREPGDGRIQVFAESADQWDRVGTIKLPPTVRFRDYAGVAMSSDRIAVVSQESSTLWVGRLDPRHWAVLDEGTVYEFPRDKHGRPRYGELEGVSWLSPERIVVVSDRAKRGEAHRSTHDESIAIFALHPSASVAATQRENAAPPVRGLFQQQFAGDEALLRLAKLRFAQAGMPAELYAGSPEQLAHLLRIAPTLPVLPTVHLDRGIDIRTDAGRREVQRFSTQFTGRVAGLVVHDKDRMAEAIPKVVAALSAMGRAGQPTIYLEYAAGMDPGLFLEIGERLRDVEGVGLCIDTGHVGIRRAHARFAALHPDLRLSDLAPHDPRLPHLVEDVQDAVASALPAVLDLITSAGRLGPTVHHHLHDGHPLLPGLADHRSFLFRLPIPFPHLGRSSLDPLYGPAGLARILGAAVAAANGSGPSLTLEIHQAEGRLPLEDATGLFEHWRDRTNAERTNYLLSVIAANHVIAVSALTGGRA
jgi:hypothetical protein